MEAVKAAKEAEDEEEDEDEDPVGDGKSDAKAAEKEPVDDGEGDSEPEPEDDGEGDSKPTGPDPTLVAQLAAIVKREIEDEEKEKKETELKLSGKKEKIDTKPSIKQDGKMNFREAIRMAVTGTTLTEGYEGHVLAILDDENIRLTGEDVRAIVVLSQMNLHIWHNETQYRAGTGNGNLGLTHGLNGIRNVAKNKIQEQAGGRKDYKIDCIAAEFKDWEVSWD